MTMCIVGILQLSNCISGEVGTICVPIVLVTYTHLCVWVCNFRPHEANDACMTFVHSG